MTQSLPVNTVGVSGSAGSDRPARGQGSWPRRPPGSGTRSRPRVLIVEDHEDTREIYAWSLRAAGWQVDAVGNGLEAVVAALATAPDVIVMDLELPVLDGITATRRLKRDEHTAHIPVVAFTAYREEHRDEMQLVGFDEVVGKPSTPEDLTKVLERLVAGRGR